MKNLVSPSYTLPLIKLNDVEYIVDFRLQELRRKDNPHDAIRFDQLTQEGEHLYTITFVTGTDNELPAPGIVYPMGALTEYWIPAYVINRPASLVNQQNKS